MSELRTVTEENLPPVLKELFAKARAGLVSPTEFLAILDVHDIHFAERWLHARDVFGLTLEAVKEIEHLRGKDLTDKDCEELGEVLEQLEE